MQLKKTDVQKAIFQQTIQSQKIYYLFANKYQATLSLLKNQRLLIFNSKSGLLYYINQPKSLPFVTQIPKPKNDCANMNLSLCKNPPGTNDFIVQFAMKNQKGQVTNVEWNFLLDNKTLAAAWVKVIQQYKDKKIQQLTQAQQQQNKPQQKSNLNKQRTNNAFIHDTIGYGVMQVPNIRNSKNSPLQKQPSPKGNQNKMSQSKYQVSPTKPNQTNIQGSNIQSNPINNNQGTNIQGSNNKQPGSNINPIPQNGQNKQNINNSNINQPPANSQNQSNINQPTVPPPSIQNSRQTNNNQLSPEGRRINLNQSDSRLTFKDELQSIISRNRNYQSNSIINESKIYKPQNDWNLKFLRNQNQEVILDFQEYAVKQFYSIINEDRKSNESIRVYIKNQSMVIVTDARTVQAKKIKSQFRNYHFIIQSCKDHFIVGVPLACLIQFQGLVVLVKSLIPDQAPKLQLTQQLMLDLKDLERYTRIKNNVLKKATLYDLSQLYQSTGKRLIYINQLIQYLPVHIEQSFSGGCLRPQHILDNVNQFMCGGMAHDAGRQDMKTLNDTLQLIKKNVSQLAKELSTQDITFGNGIQLKDIMHSRGINLKYLPLLYQQCQSKQVKKYIHTFMVAKIAKDNILQNLSQTRYEQSSILIRQTLQKSIKLLIEGNSNLSNELWKQIAVDFRKQYNVPMSNHDILGPFFLNCLMKILPGSYDISKINQKKTFFKDDDILAKGFIIELLPKVKSFYRYTTQTTQKIMNICKSQKIEYNFLDLVQGLQLQKNQIPLSLQMSKTTQLLKVYMTYFACPSQLQPQSFPHLHLYQQVTIQPPTTNSLRITYNYLTWCLQKQKFNEFKEVIQLTLKSIDYWFDTGHVFHCNFYQSLSDYYAQTGSIDQSINFIKQSLAICIRSGGVSGKNTGQKYYALAQKQFKAGRINQSKDNFLKAKTNMQTHNNAALKYPLTLMKLASLHLAQSDFVSCLQYSKQAVQKFEQMETKKGSNLPKGYYDQYSIKALQIMSRSFEIQNKKNQFYRMAQMATTKYNKTSNPKVFIQLVKLCLTAVIFKHNLQKCQVFQSFLQKMLQSSLNNNEQDVSFEESLNQLIHLAGQFNVMQRFMFKFESLQRIVSDINSRRALTTDSKQFVNIVKYIVGVVGEDYVFGLIQQKQVQ